MLVERLCKRVIPCLDVAYGRTVKGVNFDNLRSVGDPVELAICYQEQGADELTFLDVTASVEQRAIVFQLVSAVAKHLSIPFTVGGGITDVDTVKRLLHCGADKVTVNTSAFMRPQLISEIASACGSQCCVVALDVRRCAYDGATSAWEVLVNGGRVATSRDALAWARQCVDYGAGEILLTSWDKDGTLAGYDIELVRNFADKLPVPVIASGGARDAQSFVDVFTAGAADAALAASIFHDGSWTVGAVKEVLDRAGVIVRL